MELKQLHFLLEMQFHTSLAAIYVKHQLLFYKALFYDCTSGEASSLRETLELETDFSEVLLALDLMEDLLELFGASVKGTDSS